VTVRLNGSTSGYTELDAPAVAGSNTLVLPTGNGTADQVIATNGSGTLSFVDRGRMVLETAKASTSGTSVDFTGIPSWVKRVTVMFSGVSTNGTSPVQIRIGTSGGVVSSGYSGAVSYFAGGATAQVAFSAGIQTEAGTGLAAAAATRNGFVQVGNIAGNTWVFSGALGWGNVAGGSVVGGAIALSGPLTQVRITTVNGTDTFDAGSVNLLLEG
jgi:hypothetical protein